jgi:hypothetical protein
MTFMPASNAVTVPAARRQQGAIHPQRWYRFCWIVRCKMK